MTNSENPNGGAGLPTLWQPDARMISGLVIGQLGFGHPPSIHERLRGCWAQGFA
jgi:hypothetical protein